MFTYRTVLVVLLSVFCTSAAIAAENAMPDQAAAANMVSAGEQQAKMNINQVSVKDLMKIKGMTPAKARKIVAYRKKHGDFKSLDDLKKVKGFAKMKPALQKAIETQLMVQ